MTMENATVSPNWVMSNKGNSWPAERSTPAIRSPLRMNEIVAAAGPIESGEVCSALQVPSSGGAAMSGGSGGSTWPTRGAALATTGGGVPATAEAPAPGADADGPDPGLTSPP